MAKQAKVTVIIDDNGTMRLTEKDAKRLGTTFDKTNKSAQSMQRGLRGTAEMSSNSTKNFAKQSQVMQGVLVPAYATLAAQVFALTAVFRFFQSAADLRVLQEGQASYARQTGVNLAGITASLQLATESQLAFKDAAQSAAIGVAAGLTSSQLERLAVVATKASSALGRDLTDSFNRLTRGAIKAEPELLDELGIIVRLQEASTDYGRAIGKTANELTTFEKSQAVVNAVLEQGEEKFGKFEVKVNQVNKAGKAFNDLLIELQQGIAPFVELLSKAVAESGLFAAAIAGLAFAGPLAAFSPKIDRNLPGKRDIGLGVLAAGYFGSRSEAFETGEFTTKDIDSVEKSARAKASEVINDGKAGQAAVLRASKVARARIALDNLETQTSFKDMGKRIRANFDLIAAQSEGAFGRVKAAGSMAAAGLSKLFRGLGLAGVAFLVFDVVKQFARAQFALTEFSDKAAKNREVMIKQANAIDETVASLKSLNLAYGDVLDRASAFAGSVSFRTESFIAPEREAETWGKGIIEGFDFSLSNAVARMQRRDALEAQIGGLTRTLNSYKQSLDVLTGPTRRKALLEVKEAFRILAEGLKGNVVGAENLRVKLNELGAAGLGPTNKLLVDQKAKVDAAKNSVKDYSNSVSEMATSLAKGDTFKGARLAIRDVQASIAGSFQLGGKERPLSEDTLKDAETLLGTGKFNALKNRFTALGLFNAQLNFELGKLLLSYENIYELQMDKENELLSLQKDRILNLGVGSEVKLRAETLALKVKEKNAEAELAVLRQDLINLGTAFHSKEAEKLKEKIRLLEEVLGAEREATEFRKSQIINAEALAVVQNNNSIKINALKAEELRIDRSSFSSQKAIEDIRERIAQQEIANQELKLVALKTQLDAKQITQETFNIEVSKLALAKATLVNVQLQNAALQRQRDLQEELDVLSQKRLTLEGTGIQRGLGAQDSALKNIRDAQDSAALLNIQAEEKRIDSRKDGLSEKQRANLVQEAENLEKRAQVTEYQASVQGQAAASFAQQMRSGLENVFNTALSGGSIKDAILGFVSEFASTLQTAISNALVSALIQSSGLEAAITSFTNKIFAGINSKISSPGSGAGGFLSSILGVFGFGGARYGGIMSARTGLYNQMYSTGGIARGRDSGYPAILHGTEAVVPLPDGKNIPVQMKGSSGNINNVSVNVNVDQSGQASTEVSGNNSEQRSKLFAEAISMAVQQEIIVQTREGGLLNR